MKGILGSTAGTMNDRQCSHVFFFPRTISGPGMPVLSAIRSLSSSMVALGFASTVTAKVLTSAIRKRNTKKRLTLTPQSIGDGQLTSQIRKNKLLVITNCYVP